MVRELLPIPLQKIEQMSNVCAQALLANSGPLFRLSIASSLELQLTTLMLIVKGARRNGMVVSAHLPHPSVRRFANLHECSVLRRVEEAR